MPDASFPVVGIGASAGGLNALTQLLHALPPDTGMAFVLVQHLAPSHASSLAEILQRATRMPVTEVADHSRIQSDHVYVIPPGKSMVASKGVLELHPRDPQTAHRPVDIFFQSLAHDQAHHAIGVVLSGTANDGTAGLQEIKATGGITFAQDQTAEHDGMPKSAIASGCVDFVMPPHEIAAELARIARHPYIAPERVVRKGELEEKNLAHILELLRGATNVDFGNYKSSTLYRRITRRMVLQRLTSLTDYARFIAANPPETEALFQDLLIGVTSFFRNPEMFETIKDKVLPSLTARRSRHDPLRIWVLGCSSGEEAYSFGMAVSEFMAAAAQQIPVQIFATDLNAAGIEKARSGIYPRSIAQDISPARLRAFFVEVDGNYRVSKAIRELCVFARHNALTDPPFSRMDIISCRNLLIYVEPVLQRRVLPMLHYALKPNGYLLLGGSESIGGYRELFEQVDARQKIFRKKPAARASLSLPYGPITAQAAPRHAQPPLSEAPFAVQEFVKEADRILITKYAPPGVLLNTDLDILQFRGDTGPYLSPAPGRASLNVLKMAREGLLVALRGTIHKAGREEGTVRHEGLKVKSNGGYRLVNIEVVPLRVGPARQTGFLVLFDERPPDRGASAPPAAEPRRRRRPEVHDERSEQLAQELAATREYLQSLIEQQEAANEELQSANEEAQSANEELQSINEELETSKEEIQSSNEELATVNDELANRNQELARANNDLVNFLSSMETAIVMVGQDLRIRRFTPVAQRLFNLIPGYVGRPISDIQLNLGLPDLERILQEVIDLVAVREYEVQDRRGRWYSLRLRPYKTLENKIDGAVLMLVDIDHLKRARELAESLVAKVEQPMLVLDEQLRVTSATQSYYNKFKSTPAEVEGRLFWDIGSRMWDVPELKRALEAVVSTQSAVDNLPVEIRNEGTRSRLLVSASQLAKGETGNILVAIEDAEDRRRLESALRHIEQLGRAERSKDEFLAMIAHELRNPLAALSSAASLLGDPRATEAWRTRSSETIARQVSILSRLIDDLLDTARLSYGKVGLKTQVQPVQPIAEAAVNNVRSGIQARSQVLEVSMPEQPLYIEIDATRLEQVFNNLLANASKFTPPGGHIWLTVEHRQDAEGPGTVLVRVRDNGEGMAPEKLAGMFELFVQGEQSLHRPMGGLGVGLTIARRLTELLGGSIEANSEGPGRGSTFTVRLPARPAPSAAPERAAGIAERSPPATPTQRILVIDDNADAAESLAATLRLCGHSVEALTEPLQAAALAASFRPDAMVIDIGLPDIDGYELARRMRQQPSTAGAILIALTGYGAERHRLRCIEAGFDYHLVKPADVGQIEALLKQGRARRLAARARGADESA